MAAVFFSLLAIALAVLTVVVDPFDLSAFTTTTTEADPAHIRSYVVDMTLDAEGTLSAVETITVEFPVPRRGIFRIFDLANPRFDDVEHPVRDVTVTRDGAEEPFTWMDDVPDGVATIRIGQEDLYLFAGTYTYEIRYKQLGVVEPDTLPDGSDSTSLWWWDVIGSGWQVPIDVADVRVALPVPPEPGSESVACVYAEDSPCDPTLDGTSLRVVVEDLAPQEPVTVRVAFPADQVPPDFGANDDSEPWAFLLLAGIVGLGLGLFGVRATKEDDPGFPVLYEPPAGVRPAVGVWVLDEKASSNELQATLFDLGDRGIVRIERSDDDWIVRLLADPDEVGCDPWEAKLLADLGLRSPGTAFLIHKDVATGKVIADAQRGLSRGVTIAASNWLDASKAGLLVRFGAWLSLIALLVIAPMHLFGGPSAPAWLAVLLAAFAVGGSIVATDGGRSTVRNQRGREVWSRTGGFARFLSTESSESRFDAAAHMDWFPHYLPWAFALGLSEEWARRYEAQGVDIPDVPYVYGWAPMYAYGGMHSFTSSFDSAISSATRAYAATQTSSGGGGGGGFGGGSGGGGGGGGSW